MLRFNISGYQKCGAYAAARSALTGLSAIYPHKLSVNVLEHEGRDEYQAWLKANRESIKMTDHQTSPAVWTDDFSFTGGRTETLAWIRSNMSSIADIAVVSENETTPRAGSTLPNVDAFDPNHGLDYDLVVIGGGSGGLAASKEAQKLGQRVAVLDFVKPSPHGSTWGLGGTCVNVGCIPKKLMHHAALLGEHAQHAVEFGWKTDTPAKHDWETLKDNVQDHIKGLNFGYKVALRDEGVTYFNKLGSFVGPNQLEVVDKKGKTAIISSARFLIAVGGRPSLPDCPGGEHAITSDDLFMLKEAPGKTCVIGAGYVALECAGFINGLKQGEVTVLVRSMPLRGFDRDVVKKVTDTMTAAGTNIIVGVTPTKIEKFEEGEKTKYRVHLSNGESDVYDTVLSAIGRYADTAKLNLASLGVEINEKNGKIIATNEQTSVPHIYAIGDVVDKVPELTPVAIMAGRLLARRLASNVPSDHKLPEGGNLYMDYKNIATAVFTPLELGTIGVTEDEAIATYGEDNIEVYLSSFTPLEHTLLHLDDNNCLAKVITTKHDNKVVGMHIAAPNAGEIIQGFAVGMRKGMTYDDLRSTVGIHPTVGEEFVDINITRRSGADIDKSGC